MNNIVSGGFAIAKATILTAAAIAVLGVSLANAAPSKSAGETSSSGERYNFMAGGGG